MTEYIRRLRDYYIVNREHHRFRAAHPGRYELAESFARDKVSPQRRAILRLRWMLEHENPVVLPDEKIVMLRTVTAVPELFTQSEEEDLKSRYAIHELGKVCNINPDYSRLIAVGTDEAKREIESELARAEREIADRALGLRAPIGVGRHFNRSEAIGFGAGRGHGYSSRRRSREGGNPEFVAVRLARNQLLVMPPA
jgi:hypothetical protein